MSPEGPATEDLEHSRYFLTEWMPPLLRQTAAQEPPRVLVDLGAGDGGTLWPLDRAGLVGETIFAIDISARHVALCEQLSPKVKGIVSDVARVEQLPAASADAVVSSQVIEHLPDPRDPVSKRLVAMARTVGQRRRPAWKSAPPLERNQ